MPEDGPEDGIVLLQTTDPVVYRPLLEVTRQANERFCARHGLRYRAHVGIERGTHPWHATYNRIPLLDAYRMAGFQGWVLYLDADAYVADLGWDIRAWLGARAHRSIVAALGRNVALHEVNAGIVFFNFAHPDTAFIIYEWRRLFEAEVTDAMLRDAPEGWSLRPNDQDLLQRVLQENLMELWPGLGIEERTEFNAPDARLVRQILRRDAPDLATRLARARQDVARILAAG